MQSTQYDQVYMTERYTDRYLLHNPLRDIAAIGVGFVGQMCGLLLMLRGVIVQFEAGNKENIDPKLRFQMFGGGGPTRVSPA